MTKQQFLSNGNKTILKNLNEHRSSLSMLYFQSLNGLCNLILQETYKNSQGFKMNTSFAIVFPTNLLFLWPPCYLKSLKFNETAIAITRSINFHMGLSILRAGSVYFIFHQVSLSKYFKKTISIQLSLTNVKITRKDPK